MRQQGCSWHSQGLMVCVLGSPHFTSPLPVLADKTTCPDQKLMCPDDATCCQLPTNQYGCCPLQNVSEALAREVGEGMACTFLLP